MGKSSNSHGKKSDKETQSPMLKIFRDMMQRENVEPEKAKLLKEKRKNKKRKQYSTSKSDLAKSCDSSANDHIKPRMQYNVQQAQKVQPSPSQRTHSNGCSKGLEPSEGIEKNEETRSCVSCVLKRLVGNEYACVGCLLCIFTISVIFAFLLVCKTLPIATEKLDEPDLYSNKNSKNQGNQASNALKRTIEIMNENKDFGSNLRGRRNGDSRNLWDNSLSKQLEELDSLSDLSEDFGDSGLRESNGPEQNGRMDPVEAGIVVDPSKLKDERLINFYNKLIQADIQIQNLKRGYYSKLSTSVFPERLKRSLFYKKPRVEVSVKNQNGTEIKGRIGENIRVKRFQNGSIVPSGFIFEKKKLYIQYMPVEKKLFAKCSHTPKDSKSHEHEQKHPFYKNTQHLDEMLDQFLDKSFPEILNYEARDDKKKQCHHEPVHQKNPMQYVIDSTDRVFNKLVRPNVGRAKKIKNEFMKMLIDTSVTTTTKKEFNPTPRPLQSLSTFTRTHHVNHHKEGVRATYNIPTANYDLVLSISTILNPIGRKESKRELENTILKKPGRKLQQFDEDEEEGVGYHDLKEVLSDDMTNHDETDRQVERKKRDDFNKFETKTPAIKIKYDPPGVHNPNWKGPMPLYPDELNTMMKNDINKDPETDYKTELLVNNVTDLRGLSQRGSNEGQETELEDVQYIEDYTRNKYDKLVQMAQAYSDYGVLDLKKEQNDKNQVSKEKEHRVKLAADDQRFHEGSFGRPNKGSESEGIRFEIRHNGESNDKPTKLFKALSKHMRIADDDRIHRHGFHSTTLLPVYSDFNLLYSSNGLDTTKEEKSHEHENRLSFGPLKMSLDYQNNDNFTRDLVKKDNDFSVHFKSRRLKFIDVNSDYNTGDIFQFTENNTDSKQEVTSKVRSKRNVKSIDIEKIFTQENSNTRITPTSDEENISKTFNITEDFSFKNNSVIETKVMNDTEDTNIVVKQNNTKNAVMDASEFFIMLSNWFSTLSLLANETGTLKNITSNATKQTLQSNLTTKNSTTDKTTIYLEYPLYDSDMIDNIGHRSRVLLSVEEHANVSDVKPVETKEVEGTNISGGKSTDAVNLLTVKVNYDTIKQSTIPTKVNATDKEANTISNENKRDSNKNVVKRSAEDGSMIFWDDMYDEEYGIQQDPLDNALRDKHSLEKTFLRKPKKWFQDKVKKLSDSVKKCSQGWIHKKTEKKTLLGRLGLTFPCKQNKKHSIEPESFTHSIVKRDDEVDEDETEEQQPPPDKEIDFKTLTNHMKQVLKDAAKAVQQTRNLDVREDKMTGTVSAGLMQQLVKMMSDLVDFQVQQKTCLQLPSDLRDFLTWLTHGTDTGTGPPNAVNSKPEVTNEVPAWKEAHMDMMGNPSSENEGPDTRSECLGTLQALRDLMQQYNDMNDEDKSKMTGVKEYLEYQMNFLNKKLTEYDQFTDSNIYTNAEPFRYRRDTNTNIEKPQMYIHRHRGKSRNHRRLKRRLNRFLRNYGKKHTRTTASNMEFMVSNDVEIKKDNVVNNEEQLKREIKNGEEDKFVNKRNLIDVYYKALANAKMMSTDKGVNRKDFGFDKAAVVRIQN